MSLTGSRKEALQLVGQSHVVEARNTSRIFKAALARVAAALEQLGEPRDPEIEEQLKD